MPASVAYTLYDHGGTVIDGKRYNCRLTVKEDQDRSSIPPEKNSEAYFIFNTTYLNHSQSQPGTKPRAIKRQDFFSDTETIVSEMLSEVLWRLPEALRARAIPWLRAAARDGVKIEALREARVVSLEMEIAEDENDDVEDTCAICLGKLLDKEKTVVRTPCKHLFHSDCVMRWIDCPGKSCPACRSFVRILRQV